MIQINLLPPEYRSRSGTPVARFVAIVAGVVLVASATGAFAFTHFIELTRTREIRDQRKEEMRNKEIQKARSEKLQKEIDLYERRRQAIQTINRSRTLWSRKLDQFFDLITSDATEDASPVWLDRLDVPPQKFQQRVSRRPRGRSAEPESGGAMIFSGFLAMNDSTEAPARNGILFRALTGDPEITGATSDFFSDFMSINNPAVSIVNHNPGGRDVVLDPPIVGQFKYELQLKPPQQPTRADANAAANKANGRGAKR